MSEARTCSTCGAAVVDAFRHDQWHKKNEDDRTALKRAVRDLETSTKRALQQLEAMLRRSG
jgi:hypothetical protein